MVVDGEDGFQVYAEVWVCFQSRAQCLSQVTSKTVQRKKGRWTLQGPDGAGEAEVGGRRIEQRRRNSSFADGLSTRQYTTFVMNLRFLLMCRSRHGLVSFVRCRLKCRSKCT